MVRIHLSSWFLLGGLILSQTPTQKAEEATYTNITVEQPNEMPRNKDFILIDVHIPYEGEIPQRDLFIPHNEIEQNADKLLEDKSSKLVV